jgi:hypothetical protein
MANLAGVVTEAEGEHAKDWWRTMEAEARKANIARAVGRKAEEARQAEARKRKEAQQAAEAKKLEEARRLEEEAKRAAMPTPQKPAPKVVVVKRRSFHGPMR